MQQSDYGRCEAIRRSVPRKPGRSATGTRTVLPQASYPFASVHRALRGRFPPVARSAIEQPRRQRGKTGETTHKHQRQASSQGSLNEHVSLPSTDHLFLAKPWYGTTKGQKPGMSPYTGGSNEYD